MSHKIIKSRAKILDTLDFITELLPSPMAWLDSDSVILGVNERGLQAIGRTREEYVGKSIFEIYPYEMARHYEMAGHIKQHDEEVTRVGKTLQQEEFVNNIFTGLTVYFMAIKSPLRDDDGKIIGLIVTAIDITAEKEAERLKIEHLRLENEMQRKLLEEHEKFTHLATQVAHDIRSPLAALNGFTTFAAYSGKRMEHAAECDAAY